MYIYLFVCLVIFSLAIHTYIKNPINSVSERNVTCIIILFRGYSTFPTFNPAQHHDPSVRIAGRLYRRRQSKEIINDIQNF